MNLKRWGTGSLNHMFNDPPQTLQGQIEEGQITKFFIISICYILIYSYIIIGANKRRDIGSKGMFMERLMNFQRQGKEKAKKNTENEATKSQKSKNSY